MKNLRQYLGEIYREHRGLFVLMVILAFFSLIFLIFSLVALNPSAAIVKIGYSDIGSFAGDDLTGMRSAGGYRDGAWNNMFTFPILALIVGILHNFIAIRLYKRRGEGTAKVFVVMSLFIIFGAFAVLLRLLGEG